MPGNRMKKIIFLLLILLGACDLSDTTPLIPVPDTKAREDVKPSKIEDISATPEPDLGIDQNQDHGQDNNIDITQDMHNIADSLLDSDVPDICVPSTDTELCTLHSFQCGELHVEDNCKVLRTIQCGAPCKLPKTCDSKTHMCRCIPESDAQFCARNSATCGGLIGKDNCMMDRTVMCGTCLKAQSCVTRTCIPDKDHDTIPDASDNCPNKKNTSQLNRDTDTYGDACDNCDLVSNQNQADSDNDGIGDACEPQFCKCHKPGCNDGDFCQTPNGNIGECHMTRCLNFI